MRFIKLMLALSVLLGTLGSAAARAELAVIAHPDTAVAGISPGELSRIYLGKTGTLPNGERVTAIDQAEGRPTREKFYRSVVGMNPRELKSYWSKLMFTGKGKPPQSVADDRAMRDWVAGHPGSLGYIDGGAVDSSVKVLLIIP